MSVETMIEAAEGPLGMIADPTSDYRKTVATGLIAALVAFAEELEKLAADAREAAKRGWKGKSETFDACAAMLRGRAAELETHGPISEAAQRRAEALAETEAGAARLAEGARPTQQDIAAVEELVRDRTQGAASINESTALEVPRSDAATCGVRDEMGYECDREPHEPGTGNHEVHRPDGTVSVTWPDSRSVSDNRQADVAAFLRGDVDDLPDLGPAAVVDLGPASPELRETLAAAVLANPSMGVAPDLDRLGEIVGVSLVAHPPHPEWRVTHVDGQPVFPFANPDPAPSEHPLGLTDEQALMSEVHQAAEALFGTAEPATAPPWRLDPEPRPYAFDPSTSRGVPDHVSYSQITTGEACGLQLRLKKRDGVIGQPAYWNVGGTAFHACVELIESVRLGLHASSETMAGVLAGDLRACAELFGHNFDLEIAQVETETGITRDRWRVAQQGAEGDTWWRHNGALMVQGYVAHSDAMRAEGWDILNVTGKMVGLELDLNTPIGYDRELGRPVNLNARLDVVWFRWEPRGEGQIPALHLRIEDGKSGAKPVTDTFQLSLYARVLSRVIAGEFPPPIVEGLIISAAYYDARNAKSGEAFDPLAAHTWEEIEYRGLTILGMHNVGLYPANPNPAYGGPCGLCDVRHACPIMAMRD